MDSEVKQRNRRRKRAQRMQAQRDCKDKDGDSAEDDSPVREKPQRPPNRRKKSKEPLVEEDIIDGFAILGFRTYEDLEAVIKLASKAGIRKLTSNVVEEKLKTEKESQRNLSINNHHISAHPPTQHQGLTLTHDPGTSDDSGRASERLTGSSVAPRDPDSSRDRLSDASSRCSSGKGYICDSEGEDDKGSDAGSVLFASTPSTRKLEFPSALSIGNGDSSASPVPAPTPPGLAPPAPSPAAAALPPPQPPQYSTPSSAATNHGPAPPPPPRLVTPPPAVAPVVATPVSSVAAAAAVATPPSSVPVTMPQPAAAPAPVAHLPPALDSTADVNHSRTDSPAVATSANVAVAPGSTSQYPAFPSLYAPYAAHSPYTAPSPAPAPATLAPTIPSTVAASMAATVTTTSHRDIVTSSRTHSPRGHSPTRERDSYSSNVSSLSRGSVTPFSTAPPPTTATVSSSLAFSKPTPTAWPTSGAAPPQQQQPQQRPPSQPPSIVSNTAPSSQLSPATSVPRPTPPLGGMHPFPAPMFAPPPLPPPAVSTASPLGLPPNTNPNPFSAESLFQSNQADMLRRELDSRFLASQDRSLNVGPPPYLRTEMHQHQHHHTHVHQHTTPLLPPPPASTLFPTPLFKEIPKMGSVDSPFYRQNIGISSYPAYSPGLLHPGIGGPTPFVPPNHLPTFQPKQPMGDTPKPKPPVKSGKWNAMHVRVAWEIYHHQQKQQSEVKAGAKADMLRPPSHMFPGSLIHSARPHELSFPAGLSGHRPPPTFDHQPHPGSLYSNPASHLVNGTAGSGISPFSRYGTAFNAPSSPFSMSPFPGARELPPLGPMHDPWSRLQRAVPGFPPAPVPQSPWGLKPDPAVLERREQEERERERERERLRREREERERREREEKQRKQLEQQQQERERERREKERREMERREMERERERERERILHQQRLAESKQQAAAAAMAARDRSPLRNGAGDMGEVRVKEEPRTKDDDVVMLSRTTDPRYHHPYLNRHPASLPPHSMLDRSRGMLPPGLGGPPLPSHFPPPPPASHWPGPDPFRDPYRFEPLRYNPLMEAAMRAEEAKIFSAYASHPAHLRGKEPPPPPPAGLMHMRPGPGPGPPPHKICATPPTADMHKKDDSSQSR